MDPRWRAPVALTTSMLLALCVYTVAERVQHRSLAAPVPRAATLDAGSLAALADLLRGLAPADELLPATNDGADMLLAALQWSGFLSFGGQPEPRQPGELSDVDLDRINGLIGPAAADLEDV